MPKSQARGLALRTLIDYEKRDAYLGVLLSSRLADSGLERRDRALVTELVQGTARMKLTLDWTLRSFSKRPLEELESGVLWSLRLAAFQVMFTSIPDYAAVDMAAQATLDVVGRRAVGYVNAVMRAFAQGCEKISFPDRETDPAAFLEARYSHPRWIVEMWISELGVEKAEALCAADNLNPPLALRTNTLRTSRESLVMALEERGMEVEEGTLSPECLLVKGSGPPADLPEFRDGLIAIQDQGAQIVGHQVDPRPGMRVLDICAAPGGKANHLAELMGNEGSVVAVDMNRSRLAMVEQAANRLGNTIVRTVAMDARELRGQLDGDFDRVLVDAPCSGLGTLARRPDARWRKRPADVESLARLQEYLLAAGSEMVSPGGIIVYSTCTISRRENDGVVEAFLDSRSGRFEPVAAPLLKRANRPYMQLFPDTDSCDGMFAAVLRKKE